jgi:arsenate reductase
MAEGLIKKYLPDVEVFSAGSRPTGFVVKNSRKILEDEGVWSDKFYSKSIDDLAEFEPFDIVVTVCDNTKESCVNYTKGKEHLHFPISDPFLKPFEEFKKTRDLIVNELIPKIKVRL